MEAVDNYEGLSGRRHRSREPVNSATPPPPASIELFREGEGSLTSLNQGPSQRFQKAQQVTGNQTTRESKNGITRGAGDGKQPPNPDGDGTRGRRFTDVGEDTARRRNSAPEVPNLNLRPPGQWPATPPTRSRAASLQVPPASAFATERSSRLLENDKVFEREAVLASDHSRYYGALTARQAPQAEPSLSGSQTARRESAIPKDWHLVEKLPVTDASHSVGTEASATWISKGARVAPAGATGMEAIRRAPADTVVFETIEFPKRGGPIGRKDAVLLYRWLQEALVVAEQELVTAEAARGGLGAIGGANSGRDGVTSPTALRGGVVTSPSEQWGSSVTSVTAAGGSGDLRAGNAGGSAALRDVTVDQLLLAEAHLSVYSTAAAELATQVGQHCAEQGQLVAAVWEGAERAHKVVTERLRAAAVELNGRCATLRGRLAEMEAQQAEEKKAMAAQAAAITALRQTVEALQRESAEAASDWDATTGRQRELEATILLWLPSFHRYQNMDVMLDYLDNRVVDGEALMAKQTAVEAAAKALRQDVDNLLELLLALGRTVRQQAQQAGGDLDAPDTWKAELHRLLVEKNGLCTCRQADVPAVPSACLVCKNKSTLLQVLKVDLKGARVQQQACLEELSGAKLQLEMTDRELRATKAALREARANLGVSAGLGGSRAMTAFGHADPSSGWGHDSLDMGFAVSLESGGASDGTAMSPSSSSAASTWRREDVIPHSFTLLFSARTLRSLVPGPRLPPHVRPFPRRATLTIVLQAFEEWAGGGLGGPASLAELTHGLFLLSYGRPRDADEACCSLLASLQEHGRGVPALELFLLLCGGALVPAPHSGRSTPASSHGDRSAATQGDEVVAGAGAEGVTGGQKGPDDKDDGHGDKDADGGGNSKGGQETAEPLAPPATASPPSPPTGPHVRPRMPMFGDRLVLRVLRGILIAPSTPADGSLDKLRAACLDGASTSGSGASAGDPGQLNASFKRGSPGIAPRAVSTTPGGNAGAGGSDAPLSPRGAEDVAQGEGQGVGQGEEGAGEGSQNAPRSSHGGCEDADMVALDRVIAGIQKAAAALIPRRQLDALCDTVTTRAVPVEGGKKGVAKGRKVSLFASLQILIEAWDGVLQEELVRVKAMLLLSCDPLPGQALPTPTQAQAQQAASGGLDIGAQTDCGRFVDTARKMGLSAPTPILLACYRRAVQASTTLSLSADALSRILKRQELSEAFQRLQFKEKSDGETPRGMVSLFTPSEVPLARTRVWLALLAASWEMIQKEAAMHIKVGGCGDAHQDNGAFAMSSPYVLINC
eukprot:jgi/Mesvir1/13389/Mv16482-RA.2